MATGSPLTVFTWIWVALWIGALELQFFLFRRWTVFQPVWGLMLIAGTPCAWAAGRFLSKASGAGTSACH